jgi:hypothetical protein
MKFLRRIFDDALNGENIEFVVLLPAAIVTVVINLLGLVNSIWILSIILAILTLVASGILGNRHRLEDINLKLPIKTSKAFLRDFPTKQISIDIGKSSEIWLFGVHITPALTHHRSALENRLRSGKLIKVLIVDPNGHAVNMTAQRTQGVPPVELERANIVANIQDLCELKKINPQKLEIRIIDDPILFNGYLLNPEKSDGIVYLRRYTYQAGFTPKFIYQKNLDKEWFELTKAEINSLWNRGNPVSCQEIS